MEIDTRKVKEKITATNARLKSFFPDIGTPYTNGYLFDFPIPNGIIAKRVQRYTSELVSQVTRKQLMKKSTVWQQKTPEFVFKTLYLVFKLVGYLRRNIHQQVGFI